MRFRVVREGSAAPVATASLPVHSAVGHTSAALLDTAGHGGVL